MSRTAALDHREPAGLSPCGRPIECAKRRLPTLLGYLVALGSAVIITLAGCANPPADGAPVASAQASRLGP